MGEKAMTTKNPTYSPTIPKRSINWGVLLFLAILAVAATTIYLRWHAKDMHNSEADQARNCIRNNGVWKTYWEGDDIYHLICKDPATGTFFDMVVQKIREGVYKEKTAFRPKDGRTWDLIRKWLEGKNGPQSWTNNPTGPFELIGP
jgi:hypothetical protein